MKARLAFLGLLMGVANVLAAVGIAEAEPLDGERLFKQQCAVCHSVEPGKSVVGPSLFAIIDRAAGSDSTFRYSRGLKESGLAWTVENLGAFIESPRKLVPGSNMAFAGERNVEKRNAIIAYLGTLN